MNRKILLTGGGFASHIADLVISRAGSNFIFEFLFLKKPMILIPLSANSSRGYQIDNAKFFERQGYAEVVLEEDLSSDRLLNLIHNVFVKRQEYIKKMNYSSDLALDKLFSLITNSID